MIHYIRFRNFYSFGIDEDQQWAEIDFRLTDGVPESRFTFRSPSGVRLNRVLAVIGANASGKTNLIRAYSFLRFFIVRSHSKAEPGKDIPLISHIFEENNTVQFELKFELKNGRQFCYFLDATPEHVLGESLHEMQETVAQTKQLIFERKWNNALEAYDFTSCDELGFTPTANLPLRANVSTLSVAYQNAGSLITAIHEVFTYGVTNIIWDESSTMLSHYGGMTASFFKKHPGMLRVFNKVLAGLDLGLSRINIVEEETLMEKGKKSKILIPVAFHSLSGEEKELDFYHESSGTKALFTVFPGILLTLAHGGISSWDEIEGDLHPDMVLAIVRLFLQPETNPHNAQILFSSHNHEVLKLLNPDQVLLAEKEDGVFSVARRLDTIEGITMDDNIYGRYMAKAYGAKPNIQLDQTVTHFLAELENGG